MVWQDVFPNVGPKLDADHERELRLVEQARTGADWALAALIARYQPPVTRYLTRLTGSPTGARTLAEHVFIRMERRLHGSQGGRQLRLWLLRACTEAGLEMLRGPREAKNPRLVESRRPVGLLPSGSTSATSFLRTSLGKLASATGSTSRQVRKLIWADAAENEVRPPRINGHHKHLPSERFVTDVEDDASHPDEDGVDMADPREALRHRMVRAVLAELPYGDAQCLALHLVAGLNQAEVALALGITASATRRRIVHGLTLFAQRYDAAAASLGLPLDFFDPRADPPMQDGARFDGAERHMPTVAALADDLEVDPLTTNEHIAVQPFAHDNAALIWSGHIQSEEMTKDEAGATHESSESEPMIVDTSLAHVGEPMEIPEPLAVLPSPPDIPLTMADMRLHAEAYEPVDAEGTLSSPLAFEEIILPATALDGKLQRPADDETRRAEMLNGASNAPSRPDVQPGDGSDIRSVVYARVVPILTSSSGFDAKLEKAAIAENGAELAENKESEFYSTHVVRSEMGHTVRMVPVLSTDVPRRDGAMVNRTEARMVPVLTSSPPSSQMTLSHMLDEREERATGSD